MLWCYSPTSCDIVEHLPHAKLVYDCVDRHSAYKGHINPKVVDKMEHDLAKPADQVFATAVGLAETLEKVNPTTQMIPNGAAYEIFSRVQTEKDTLPCPEDIKDLPHPIYGFVGMLQECIDYALIEKLGLPRGIFQPIRTAGTVLGHLTPEIQKAVGFDAEVILPATHDTGSAFLAVPARDEYAAYLSSGTWSLLGVENAAAITGPDSCAANFTNEGGYEYRYRYLKNIMGLWMIQSVRRELGEKTGTRPSFPELIAAAKEAADFPSCVDPDDNRFLAPASMIEEVRAACADTHQPVPAATGEVMQCVYNSLTQDYRRAVETLQSLTGKTYTSLNIVGGGSQDGYLNQQTANATGLTVFAGPTEGTALGNLMVQFIHSGDFADLAEARAAIRRSFEIKEYQPE